MQPAQQFKCSWRDSPSLNPFPPARLEGSGGVEEPVNHVSQGYVQEDSVPPTNDPDGAAPGVDSGMTYCTGVFTLVTPPGQVPMYPHKLQVASHLAKNLFKELRVFAKLTVAQERKESEKEYLI